jgi:hypothetical protein
VWVSLLVVSSGMMTLGVFGNVLNWVSAKMAHIPVQTGSPVLSELLTFGRRNEVSSWLYSWHKLDRSKELYQTRFVARVGREYYLVPRIRSP